MATKKNCDKSKKERARRLAQKRKPRKRAKMQPLPPGKIDEYKTEEQLAKQRMVVLGNDHILAFGKVFETSLTFLNSFSIHFAIHLKSIHAMPTNSNGHVSVQRSLRCM